MLSVFQMGDCLQPCSYHCVCRFVDRHLFKCPVCPLSLHLTLAVPCPFSACLICFSFGLSASLAHFLYFPFTPALLMSSSYRAILRNLGIWRSLETTEAQPSLDVPLPCG